jgi:hypothetical protein
VSTVLAQTVTIPSPTATGVALSAASQYRVLSDQQWTDDEDVVVLSTLNVLSKLAPNAGTPLASADYSNAATLLRGQLDKYAPSAAQFQNQDEATRLRYGIDMVCIHVPAQQPSVLLLQALYDLEKIKFRQLETTFDPSRQAPADLASFSLTGRALQFIANQVQQTSDLAVGSAQYASVVNPILRDLIGFDTTNSYAQIQGGFGSLPTLPAPNTDGSYTINTANLVTQYQTVVGNFQAIVDADIAAFESANQSSAASNLRFVPRRRSLLASESPIPRAGGTGSGGSGGSDLSKCGDPCKTAQTAVTAISGLVKLSDSTLGSQIATVGGAAISAGFAIDQIATGVSAILAGAAAGSVVPGIGTAVGALVGAAIDIFSSVFGSSGSANAGVQQALNKISNQIANLQKDMDAQFAVVDTNLNTIFTTLNVNFQQIDYTLGTLSGNVQTIQEGLLDVQTQLNQLAWYNSYYHQAEEQDALMLSVNSCINYRANHNNLDIGQSPFDTCQNVFFTYAQTNALDGIWSPLPPSSAYTDHQVLNTFSDFHSPSYAPCSGGCPTPFAVLTNFLSQYPALNLGQSALSSVVPLANPDEWTLGARAYLEMSHEFPQYALNRGRSYLDQMITIGTNLQQAAQNINSSRPTGGPITSNQSLLGVTGVTGKYTAAVTALQTAANGDMTSYISNPANGITKNGISLCGGATPCNLFAAGANQHTSWRPSISSVPFCNGSAPLFPTSPGSNPPSQLPSSMPGGPSALLSLVPDLYAFSQGYLPSGQLSACVSQAQWLNVQDHSTSWDGLCESKVQSEWANGVPFADEYGVSDCQFGNLMVTVNINFKGVTIMTASATSSGSDLVSWSSFESICGGGDNQYYCDPATFTVDPNAALEINWTSGLNMQAQLNSSPQSTQQPQPQLLSGIASQLDSQLAGHQQNIYKMVANDFGNAGSAVQQAGILLDGGALLFQAYANLGLPNSLQDNTPLHAALYGSQAIAGSSTVQSDFAAFANAAISDTTDNKIIDEVASINSRLAPLTTALTGSLNQVQQNQLPESLTPVDITLEDLQAFAALQSVATASNGVLSPCDYELSSDSSSFNNGGGAVTITVTSASGCAVNASSGSPWLNVTTIQTAPGQFQVSIEAVGDSSDTAQAGIVIIGDQLYHVLRNGNTSVCTYSLGGGPVLLGSRASSGTIGVVTGPGCTWGAITNTPSWLSIASGAGGSGAGSVGFQVTANTSPTSRTGTLSIAGMSFTVNQASPCDVNVDGATNIVDVQTMIDEVLTLIPGVNNPSNSGHVSLSDVQFTINGALGRGCSGN